MRDFVREMKRTSREAEHSVGFGFYEKLTAGRFEVSIQASRTHYSTPRALLPSADGYSAFEVGIFEGKKWVLPLRDPRLKDKSWAQLFEDGDVNAVAGYVPRETVAQIIADLEAVAPPYCPRCNGHHEREGDAEEKCQRETQFARADHRRRGGVE